MGGRCSFGPGANTRPDGLHELDACEYEIAEEHRNVTVRVLRCVRCGHTEVTWVPGEEVQG